MIAICGGFVIFFPSFQFCCLLSVVAVLTSIVVVFLFNDGLQTLVHRLTTRIRFQQLWCSQIHPAPTATPHDHPAFLFCVS